MSKVTVDGKRFEVVKNKALGELQVWWDGDPPPNYGLQLGTLLPVSGTDFKGELAVMGVEQRDYPANDHLLRRVAIAAGYKVRPPRAK